ncbi:MAG: cation-translocating P-type ATPase [Myxococcota bacterium]
MAAASPGAGQPRWHQLPAEAVLAELGVDAGRGLSAAEVAARRRRFGPNRIQETRRRGPLRILAGQFADFMIFVLIVAAVISGVVGEVQDTLAIVAIVLLNAVIGAVQEYRAERAVAALRELAAPEARALRDGHWVEVASTELVPGDVVQVEAGNVVPADLRFLEVAELLVDESALTGESLSVGKQSDAIAAGELSLGDRFDLGFQGTLVTSGRAMGVVVATGMGSELGQVAGLLGAGGAQQTPLQQRLARFGRTLSIGVLGVCAVIFAAGLLRGEPPALMFLTAVTLAVAAIPEALPAVVTVALALGARKMSRRHALIRRLPAVETLGSVTTICADKTGTLTQNRMHVESLVVGEARERRLPAAERSTGPWLHLAHALALNNDAHLGAEGVLLGEPTEAALARVAREAGFERAAVEAEHPRLAELPFEAERKCMTTLHAKGGEVVAYCKGAPERVLAICSDRLTADGPAPLDRDVVLAQAEALAADGQRVLAFAMRTLPAVPEALSPETVEREMRLLGLVGLMDPPREEAAASVALCRSAGVTPIMITGDHPGTARAIAERLAIAEAGAPVLTGLEVAALSPAELRGRVEEVRVYARIAPAQKLRIVEALQAQGHFVAMTGDGVNDAPALKRAEIGVAMGQKGTDVARQASDMVLLDDDFSTIVAAVGEGRRIFDNIRKFIKDTMSSNSGEIWTLFLAPFLGLPIPLLPIHILWINLVTDGLPGLAFSAEPAERGVMARPPRPPGESLFAHGMWQHVLWVGLFVGLLSLGTEAWAWGSGLPYWQTMVFTVLTVSQIFHSLAVRSERQSLLRLGLWSNPAMLGAVLLTLGLQLAVIYVPALQPVFHTQPLPGAELALCLGLALLVPAAVEVEKWAIRRGWLYASPAA